MKFRIVSLIVPTVLMFGLAGCVTTGSTNVTAGSTTQASALNQFGSVAEAASQLAGATAAIAALTGTSPSMPILDSNTQAQIASYAGWANLGLKALGIISTAVGGM